LSEQDLPQDVRALIHDHIDSVAQLEVLLLLYGDTSRTWTAEDLARELRIDPRAAEQQLDLLCARGLLTCSDAPPRVYQYVSRPGALDNAVGGLQRAYADRRVTVIGAIYSKPTDPLRRFADAFRIRKDPENG
jgi:predicted ArsR family transcriptional regulator